MSYDEDEILQDFLVESQEVIEELSELLVELESGNSDTETLNAIFRGFHTLKGGAGFLNLDELVDFCHLVEDLFDKLRSEKIKVSSRLIDITLESVDVVQAMCNQLSTKKPLAAAPASLIKKIEMLSTANDDGSVISKDASETTAEIDNEVDTPAPDNDNYIDQVADPCEQQFERMLANVEQSVVASTDSVENTLGNEQDKSPSNSNADLGLQEQLTAYTESIKKIDPIPRDDPKVSSDVGADIDSISEQEFDALLDQLYGKDGAPTQPIDQSLTESLTRNDATPVVESPQLDDLASSKKHSASVTAESEKSIRVDRNRLDDIVNLVGELVLLRNRLSTLFEGNGEEKVADALLKLDGLTGQLQEAVLKTRVQPIRKIFSRFPRIVRDFARGLDKDVRLVIKGDDTELDKTVIDIITEPLTHIIRNSIDHGIETKETRLAEGKPKTGEIILSAEQSGDQVLLKVIDDGAGISVPLLIDKLVEKGIHNRDYLLQLDKKDIYPFIFLPGLSTKDEVSDVSGRGVGMDAVKVKVAQLNGSIEVDSELGFGTEICLKLPLTLAIVSTLMIEVAGQVLALPLSAVDEIVQVDISTLRQVNDQSVFLRRGKTIEIYDMVPWVDKQKLGSIGSTSEHELPVVLVSSGEHVIGLIVDKLLGQEEVVVKPLDKFLSGTAGIAGATITGDGNIALVLDISSLVTSLRYKAPITHNGLEGI